MRPVWLSRLSPYSEAIADGDSINKCPPGGEETIQALADLLDVEPQPLDAEHGVEKEPVVAWIREDECIGCTKCIQACPVDAILGAAKVMHTVIADECTGCDLCIEPCPVDCIDLIPRKEGIALLALVPARGSGVTVRRYCDRRRHSRRRMRAIHDIHGGIHPPERKALSRPGDLQNAPIPPVLVLPSRQHLGGPCPPVVAVGDTVLGGQVLAEAQGVMSVPVHAPTSGTVSRLSRDPSPTPRAGRSLHRYPDRR